MKRSNNSTSAVILAAGSGSRMLSDTTKQRMTILGESILHRSVRAFSECDSVGSIVVVCRADELDWAKSELFDISTPLIFVIGGKSRAESARLGFEAIPADSTFVAIHDAARCLVTSEIIHSVITSARINGAATAATPVIDTLKRVDSTLKIVETVSRDSLYSAQTPQVFLTSLYKKALENANTLEGITDDNMLIEGMWENVAVVDTGRENIKVTTPDDIKYAEHILERWGKMAEYRIGHGYDVHRFAENRALIIGGVEIPFERGLLGHSDADVLTHAVMDALLGAAGLGDIGRHFPDTSVEYRDISSLMLLKRAADVLSDNGYAIVNIDATVVLEKPKIAPHIDQMRENISRILAMEISRVNIKATTEEGLGFTGSGEGAAAYAVAMLKK